MMKKLTPVILLLSFSLNVSAFDASSIEGFYANSDSQDLK